MEIDLKKQAFIIGRLTVGQNLIVQRMGQVSVYTTYDDLINNTNQINVPVNGVLTYNGPYSQPAVYSFNYNNQPALIPQENLYTMLQITAFRIIVNTLF